MIHYSCDRCGRPIASQLETRYVVRIEVEAAWDPTEMGSLTADDRDHLLELQEMLEGGHELADAMLGESICQRQRFDLCGECHRKFLKNPLAKESTKQLDFSQN